MPLLCLVQADMKNNSDAAEGFTLVELLVVIAISFELPTSTFHSSLATRHLSLPPSAILSHSAMSFSCVLSHFGPGLGWVHSGSALGPLSA